VKLGATCALLLAVTATSACDDNGPRLSSVMPTAGRAGDIVAINGTLLCGANDSCDAAAGGVTFGLDLPARTGAVVSASPTQLSVAVPPGLRVGKTELFAVINGESSNTLSFEVLP
jgi:hypothetical protein